MNERYTVGVEEEYQLLDARTHALASRAEEVLDTDWADRLEGELQETMLEIGTPVCRTAADVDRWVRELRFHTATAAAAHDLVIAAAGMHPFSSWRDHRTTTADRSALLLDELGLLARDEQFFGLHVHVNVSDDELRMRTLGIVRHFVPHLLALSCSSPLLEGRDTGYASFRTVLTRRLLMTGPPPRFGSVAEYRAFADAILTAGALPDERTIYWSVRPSSRYPTLEFRAPDANPRVEEVVAIACMTRAITAAAAEGVLTAPDEDDDGVLVLLRLNEWLVARGGLDATLVLRSSSSGVPVRDAIRKLLDVVRPVAQQLGDEPALELVEAMLDAPSVADQLRTLRREGSDDRQLAEWLSAETLVGVGMDRRRAQRAEGDVPVSQEKS